MKATNFLKWFARIALVCLTLFVGVTALYAGNSLVDVVTVATLATAPFAFVLPDAIKSKMTKEEQEGIKELGDQIATYLSKQERGELDQKDLNEKVKSAWDNHAKLYGIEQDTLKSLQDTLKAQGIEISALKESKRGKESFKSLDEQISDWVKSQDYKDSLSKRQPSTLHVKAATPFSVRATSMGTTTGLNPAFTAAPELFRIDVDRTINSAPTERNFLFDLFWKGSTDSTMIVFFNRVNKQGGAVITPEFGVKQPMSWEYERETAQPIKIPVSVKLSTEMMNDASFIAGEIRTVTTEELWTVTDKAVLDHVEGMATAYLGTGLDDKVSTPNNADAIRAAILQLRNLNHFADVLLISPTAKAELDLTKSSTGNYMKQEIDAILKGLRIEESTKLDEGEFILADSRRVKVKNKGGISISTGWGVNAVAGGGYKSDYEMNAVTMIVEHEIYIYHNTIDEVAVVRDTFANVKLALLKA